MLVADPTEPLATTLRSALAGAGHEVMAVTTADAAMTVVRDRDPGAVFASASEVFNAAALCQRIHQIRPTCPVVMVFFPDADHPEAQARAAGADGFLVAPLTAGTVASTAETMLRLRDLRERLDRLEGDVRSRVERRVVQSSDFDLFKQLLLMEVKRSRRYQYPVAFLLVGIDELAERTAGLDVERRVAVGASVLKLISTTVRDVDFTVPSSEGRFLVFLTHTPPEGAITAATRIRERVARLDVKPKLTASVGVACYVPGSSSERISFGLLMRDAVANLERAQKAGGDRVEAGTRAPKRGRTGTGWRPGGS